MASENFKKKVSLFLIFLIISLQFNISFAFASLVGQIEDITIHGKDNIEDVLRHENDTLHMSAKVSLYENIEGDDNEYFTLTEDNVRFQVDSSTAQRFSSCDTDTDGFYICTYSDDDFNLDSKKYSLKINLYDDNLMTVTSSSKDFYVDGMPPKFTKLDIPKTISTKTQDIEFSVADHSCSGCGSNCIGLEKIVLRTDNKTLETKTDVSGCSYSGNFSLTKSSLNQGDVKLCIDVYDKMGLYNSNCDNVLVDFSKPKFSQNSFVIKDLNGNVLTFSSNDGIKAHIEINVSDELSGINPESIKANLSNLNPKYSNELVFATNCEPIDEFGYNCVFKDILIKDIKDSSIMFYAEDDSKNIVESSFSFNLPLDTTPPILEGVVSSNDEYVNPTNTIITAKVTETDSAMFNANAYFGANGESIKASECNLKESLWHCDLDYNFDNLNDGDEIDIFLTELTNDAKLSANISSLKSKKNSFIYDGKTPEVINISISPYASNLEVATVDDVLEVVALIKEEHSGLSADNAYLNFSDFDSNANLISASSCDELEDFIYECKWEYSGDLDSGEKFFVDLKVNDNAGNILLKEKVTGINVVSFDDRKVDFWAEESETSKIDLNPNFLWMSDQGTIVRATATLVSKSGNPYVHNFHFTSCSTSFNSTGAIEILSQSNLDSKKSKILLFKIPQFDKKDIKGKNSFKFTCEGQVVQATSQFGNIYSENELVNATFDIRFSESLFLDPALKSIDDIRESEDMIDKLDTIIEWIDKLKIFKTICKIFNAIKEILNGITMILEGISTVFTPTQGATDASKNIMDRLNGLWYGSGEGTFGSSKSYASVGFWCDLFLCTECNRMWQGFAKNVAGKIGGDESGSSEVKVDTNEYITIEPKQGEGGTGEDEESKATKFFSTAFSKDNIVSKLEFDPFRSLPVAVICMPPCIEGIRLNLVIYREILVNYNICLNIAETRGYGRSECEDFKSTRVCSEIVRHLFFTDTIAALIRNLVVGMVFDTIDEKLKDACNVEGGGTSGMKYTTPCGITKILAILEWLMLVSETYEKITAIPDMFSEFSSDDDEEKKKDIEKDL
ncbi:MAG: hypothetical protein ACLFPJ_03350 [Candidatus Woesearchaeota archaeon]